MFRSQITWLEGEDLTEIMNGFKELCSFLAIHGSIDVTHIHMFKPKISNMQLSVFPTSLKPTTCSFKL